MLQRIVSKASWQTQKHEDLQNVDHIQFEANGLLQGITGNSTAFRETGVMQDLLGAER